MCPSKNNFSVIFIDILSSSGVIYDTSVRSCCVKIHVYPSVKIINKITSVKIMNADRSPNQTFVLPLLLDAVSYKCSQSATWLTSQIIFSLSYPLICVSGWLAAFPQRKRGGIRQYLFVQQNLAVPVLLFDCSALTSGSCQIKQDGELSSHTIQKIKQTQTASFLYLSFTPPVPEDRSKPATLPALVYFQLICLVHFVFSFIYKCGGGIVCKCHVKKNV